MVAVERAAYCRKGATIPLMTIHGEIAGLRLKIKRRMSEIKTPSPTWGQEPVPGASTLLFREFWG